MHHGIDCCLDRGLGVLYCACGAATWASITPFSRKIGYMESGAGKGSNAQTRTSSVLHLGFLSVCKVWGEEDGRMGNTGIIASPVCLFV